MSSRDDVTQAGLSVPSTAVLRSVSVKHRRHARFALHHGENVFPLQDGETIIGRSDRAGVIIDSLAVSRLHAKIVVEGGCVTLHDLQSRNGTFVGETRVDTATQIAEGMEIRLGPIWFTLRSLEKSLERFASRSSE